MHCDIALADAPFDAPRSSILLDRPANLLCSESSRGLLFAASAGGHVALYEPSLRTRQAVHFDRSNSSDLQCVAAGQDSIAVFGGGQGAGGTYVGESNLQLFDVRMMRFRQDVPLMLHGQNQVISLEFCHGDAAFAQPGIHYTPDTVLVTTFAGAVQAVDASSGALIDSFATTSMSYGIDCSVVCSSIASSAELFAVADQLQQVMVLSSMGDAPASIATAGYGQEPSEGTVPDLSAAAKPGRWDDAEARLNLAMDASDGGVADLGMAARGCCAKLLEDDNMDGMIAEDLSYSPALFTHITEDKPLWSGARRRLVDDLLASAHSGTDWLVHVPNAGYPVNSLIFGSAKAKVYHHLDARKHQSVVGSLDDFDGASVIPARFRKPEMILDRFGLAGFDFGAHTLPEFAGLEDSGPNAYCNAALQLLFLHPVLRRKVCEHIQPDTHCALTEAKFLFDMLWAAPAMHSKQRSCQAQNFIRSLLQNKEARDLGLFAASSLWPLQRITRFFGFVLKLIQTEIQRSSGGNAKKSNKSTRGGQRSRRKAAPVLTAEQPFQMTATVCEVLETAETRSRAVNRLVLDLKYDTPCAKLSELVQATADCTTKIKVWSDATGRHVQCDRITTLSSLPDTLFVQAECTSLQQERMWRQDDFVDTTVSLVAPDAASEQYDLVGVLSAVTTSPSLLTGSSNAVNPPDAAAQAAAVQFVLHAKVNRATRSLDASEHAVWTLFNDFSVTESTASEVTDFSGHWRFPVLLVYVRRAAADALNAAAQPCCAPIRAQDLRATAGEKAEHFLKRLPESLEGVEVAIDAEFVAVALEQAEVLQDGRRVISRPARLSPGRVSCVLASGLVLMDDFVSQAEPVADYLTRFSGLSASDFSENPASPSSTRKHTVVPMKVSDSFCSSTTAYVRPRRCT